MPHVIVKLYAGKTEQQKSDLAAKIAAAVTEVMGSKDSTISVAVEEFDPADWKDKVYTPDITQKAGTLVKKPGYAPA
jgi:4-oxalocrotonate tautomerase